MCKSHGMEYDCNSFEVVGNIFDNSELLEGGACWRV